METYERVITNISTSPLVNVKLTSIVPYIILHGVAKGHLNDLINYFVAMTDGLGRPCFVIGIWSFYAATTLLSVEEIMVTYPNVIVNPGYYEIKTAKYNLLILRQEESCLFGKKRGVTEEVSPRQTKREKETPFTISNAKRKAETRQELSCPNLVSEFPCPIEGIGYKRWFAQAHARASGYDWILMLDKNVGPIQRCINQNGKDYFGMGEPKGGKCCFMTFTETVAAIQEREADHDYVSYFAKKEFTKDNTRLLNPVMWGIRVGLVGSGRSIAVSGASYKFYIQYLAGIPEKITYRWEHMTFGEDFAFAKLLEKNNLSIRKYGIFSSLDLREMNPNGNISWCTRGLQIPLDAAIIANKADTPNVANPTRDAMQKSGYCLGWRLIDYCDVYQDLVGAYTSTSLLAPIIEQNGKIYGQNVSLFTLDASEWDPQDPEHPPGGLFDHLVEYDFAKNIGYLRGYLPFFLLKEKYEQRSNKYAANWLYVDVFARILSFLHNVTSITTQQANTIQKLLLPFPLERDYVCGLIAEKTKDLVCRPQLKLSCNFQQDRGYLAPPVPPRNIRPFLETRRKGRVSYKEQGSNDE